MQLTNPRVITVIYNFCFFNMFSLAMTDILMSSMNPFSWFIIRSHFKYEPQGFCRGIYPLCLPRFPTEDQCRDETWEILNMHICLSPRIPETSAVQFLRNTQVGLNVTSQLQSLLSCLTLPGCFLLDLRPSPQLWPLGADSNNEVVNTSSFP